MPSPTADQGGCAMSSGETAPVCPCCKALWVKFRLTGTLTRQGDAEQAEKAKAKVYSEGEVRHYWQGDDPAPGDIEFDVYNLEDVAGQDPKSYRFEGTPGDVGLACLDDSDPEEARYRVVSMCYSKVVKLGKLDGTLAYGGSATCSIWTGPPASKSDSGEDVTVYCWLLQPGESIANGTKVVIALVDGSWFVIDSSCP
jgi:hypothetical protein